MSYRRTFTKTIYIHYSGSVSYPASQSGGTVGYSGTASETVYVNIDVDTDPFDHSVRTCNNNVGLLTGAVVATETAQIASIKNNAQRVGQTIVQGFFKTISSEISQQIMELTTRLDSLLLHLRELGKRCVDKQRQMQSDYNRLSSRYMKIFDDLNHELENRIYELDRPTFNFKRETDLQALRSTSDDLVGSAAVSGSEAAALQARISASKAKYQAYSTIGCADRFLHAQKQMERTIDKTIHTENKACGYGVPVCYVATESADGVISRTLHQPATVTKMPKQQMIERFEGHQWQAINNEQRQTLLQHLSAEVQSHLSGNDRHSDRVREQIYKLFNESTLKQCVR